MKYQNAYTFAAAARVEVNELPRLLNGLKQTIATAAATPYASSPGQIIMELERVRASLRTINNLLVKIDTEMRT